MRKSWRKAWKPFSKLQRKLTERNKLGLKMSKLKQLPGAMEFFCFVATLLYLAACLLPSWKEMCQLLLKRSFLLECNHPHPLYRGFHFVTWISLSCHLGSMLGENWQDSFHLPSCCRSASVHPSDDPHYLEIGPSRSVVVGKIQNFSAGKLFLSVKWRRK